ncbi:MAG: hypothetical protein JSR47_01040 [Proteobacteria bacterium]|nr:hypothetical protein [Pseudomonadota bacterium]
MADRATDTNAIASAADVPAKKPYVAPVVVHWGNFRDVTQTNRHSRRSDSRRSDGTN